MQRLRMFVSAGATANFSFFRANRINSSASVQNFSVKQFLMLDNSISLNYFQKQRN